MATIAAWLTRLGPLINVSLSAAVAIISGSFFLYGLARDFRSRVARAFSALLFFVTITFIGDLGVTYSDSMETAAQWLRFQWIGIAFAPAVYIHLSDAILTMTGLPSRGRRRWTVRSLYVVAAVFLVLVFQTDWIVHDPLAEPAPHFQPGAAFPVFLLYFVSAVALSMWFVIRARNRTLTEISRRRLTYLLIPYVAPALAAFPFLLLISGRGGFSTAVFYAILIVFDAMLAVMLTFMAYPLAFFGSLQPDRLVKSQMLQFFLRGPVVAIAALGVLMWAPGGSRVLGLSATVMTPMLVVMTILGLQWAITLIRPLLERLLIYVEDHKEVRRIKELEERLLTAADFRQLLDSILVTICDYLRVRASFVASVGSDGAHLEKAVGLNPQTQALMDNGQPGAGAINGRLPMPEDITTEGEVFIWQGFWLIPLHTTHNGDSSPRLVGLLGIAAPAARRDTLDPEKWRVLMALATRCAEVLEDRRLQSEIFMALEGIMPEIAAIQRLRGAARYGGVEVLTSPLEEHLDPRFTGKIKEALTHYWGGPRLTDDSLLKLAVVRQAMDEHEGNPQRAIRSVLQRAIESLKPEGQRSMTTTEWILYNILEMRFIQGRKVREVAMRLAMSESDLYRKQRVAIEAVAAIIMDMERHTDENGQMANS